MKSFKSLFALMAFTILLFVSGSLQQNYVFSDASTVSSIPTSIAFDNNLSPDDASLSLCSELSSATSFVWYKIDATSSLRTISIDTCDVDFDSIIGVFSGADFASLISLGCNDDRASASGSCNPSSSALENISISSGETIYIVVGSFIDPYTSIPSLGSGHLQITVIDPTTLQCTSDLILQVEQDLVLDISNLQSTITSAITSAKNQLQSDLSDTQTAITTAIDNSESNLSTDIQGVQDTADSIETVVTSTATTVSSISSLLTTVDGKVDTIESDLLDVDTNVNALGTQVDNLSTSATQKFTDTNTNIDGVQSTADQIVILSNQLLGNSSDIQSSNDDISSQISSFQTATATSFSDVDNDVTSINTQIDDVNANLLAINNDLDTVDQSVSSVSSKISALSSSVDTKFTNTNTNIDDLQTTADQIVSLANQALVDSADIQSQQADIAVQLSDFEASTATSFGASLDALATVDNAVASLQQTSQASFSDRADSLSTLQTSSNSIHSDTTSSLNLLNTMQSNVNADTNQAVFVDTLIRYLPDKSIVNPPLFIRMPNVYGGRMNDAATHVVAQYNALKTAALAIGAKSSLPCTSNAFCNYFLNTADAAYADSMAKYNSYLNLKKFLTAYSYLQQAFINLYPSTW